MFFNENIIIDILVVGCLIVLEGLVSLYVYFFLGCGGGGICGKCVFLSLIKLFIILFEEEYLF